MGFFKQKRYIRASSFSAGKISLDKKNIHVLFEWTKLRRLIFVLFSDTKHFGHPSESLLTVWRMLFQNKEPSLSEFYRCSWNINSHEDNFQIPQLALVERRTQFLEVRVWEVADLMYSNSWHVICWQHCHHSGRSFENHQRLMKRNNMIPPVWMIAGLDITTKKLPSQQSCNARVSRTYSQQQPVPQVRILERNIKIGNAFEMTILRSLKQVS